MIRGFRRFISAALVLCAFAATSAVSGDNGANSNSQNLVANKPQIATGGIIEVRIRRLHLVRPDLIPYPIAYEIVC
jgi:hypothetical protein